MKNEPECGISQQNAFSKRIIGGDRAKFAELPWQVRTSDLAGGKRPSSLTAIVWLFDPKWETILPLDGFCKLVIC